MTSRDEGRRRFAVDARGERKKGRANKRAQEKLPESLTAERSILGGILVCPLAFRLTTGLRPRDFVLPSHSLIFQRIMDLADSGSPIDITTVVEELNRHGELEEIGGSQYVSALLDGVPDSPSIERYVDIVRETSGIRQMVRASEQTACLAMRGGVRLPELLARHEEAIKECRLVADGLSGKLRRRRAHEQYKDGAAVLEANAQFVGRFVLLSEAERTVIAVWIVHTHAIDAALHTPYLSITSAEKQSGKTRLLEVLDLLVAKAWFTGRVTTAVLVRKIDAVAPTLLLDEMDAAFRGDPEYSQALRGILNTGYRAGATASMCVGKGTEIEARDFRTFCPKVLAGIGDLPDTVADRSIPIRLKRRAQGEGHIQRFRHRIVAADAENIRESTAAWVQDRLERLRLADPELPDSLTDRQQDCVEPLLAIADEAGGEWPNRVRRALIEIFGGNAAEDSSLSVKLLADIKQVFELRASDRLTSKDLIEGLTGIETSPWAEYSHGRPLSPNRLAKLLIPFGIYPRTIRVGEATVRGYVRDIFKDAWDRYLRSSSGFTSAPTAFETQQSPQCSIYEGESHFSEPQHPVLVADENSEKLQIKTRVVAAVAFKTLDSPPQRTNWPVEGEL